MGGGVAESGDEDVLDGGGVAEGVAVVVAFDGDGGVGDAVGVGVFGEAAVGGGRGGLAGDFGACFSGGRGSAGRTLRVLRVV